MQFWSFRDYVWMHVWSAVVGAVAIPAWFFVPESPRWLACNKRVKEAEDIIMVREQKIITTFFMSQFLPATKSYLNRV